MEYVRHKWVSGRGGEFSHPSLIKGFDVGS